jgi:hypothetical protein
MLDLSWSIWKVCRMIWSHIIIQLSNEQVKLHRSQIIFVLKKTLMWPLLCRFYLIPHGSHRLTVRYQRAMKIPVIIISVVVHQWHLVLIIVRLIILVIVHLPACARSWNHVTMWRVDVHRIHLYVLLIHVVHQQQYVCRSFGLNYVHQ